MCGNVLFICAQEGGDRFGSRHTKPERTYKVRCLSVGAAYVGGKFMIGENVFVQSVKPGVITQNQRRAELPPPCRACYQVKNPAICENKDCKCWRTWFVAQWNDSRQRVLQQIKGKPQLVPGIPLGGRQYYHPEHLMRYLYTDPCKACYLAGCQCQEPCQLRRNWEDAREEAGL